MPDRRPAIPPCTWCGHPPHRAGGCPRLIDVRVYRRGFAPVDDTVTCPCSFVPAVVMT